MKCPGCVGAPGTTAKYEEMTVDFLNFAVWRAGINQVGMGVVSSVKCMVKGEK